MATKRKPEELAVPDITEDPAERKRVLNVLAQRRYRRRKRERLESLQAQVTHGRPDETRSPTSTPQEKRSSSSATPGSSGVDGRTDGTDVLLGMPAETGLPSSTSAVSSNTGLIPDIWSPSQMFSLLSPNLSPRVYSDPSASTIDALTCLSPPHLLLEPFSQATDGSEEQNIDSRGLEDNAYSLSDQLQMYQTSTFTFPDDSVIEIPSLTLLNAAMAIATRLKIVDVLWDVTAISPFYQGKRPITVEMSFTPASLMSPSPDTSSSDDRQDLDQVDVDTLPENFRPTPSQRLIPHHPIIDLLPWPSARDKLIQVFSLPVGMRPKAAQDPMGVFRFAYDMEDTGGEGIRMQGTDPFSQETCEIGQVIFERWWWAFDAEIVERSNRARRKRGEGGLRLLRD
ncbi:hypothetical protein ATEIFO6365_0001016900 [Aspergillus terreus]|uniref:Uncharacterized protein n=1 Tax=Aspergillus terreus TaxID=33178 RepID=A0A5M3YZS2_ASPTE|nr:hypothetical protein ATETN484_0006046400 [Aspergillus terreus]GFF11946.1 hypothetical protein ATEIFO6365_0001016900 [Aspergillus terreus]